MPNKDAMIRARITQDLKKSAENVLRELGITPSEAINIFYAQIVLQQGIPFEVNLETGDTEENYTKIKSSKHLKNLLGLDDV